MTTSRTPELPESSTADAPTAAASDDKQPVDGLNPAPRRVVIPTMQRPAAEVLIDRVLGRRLPRDPTKAEALEVALRMTQVERDLALADADAATEHAADLEGALESIASAVGETWDGEQPVKDNAARLLSRVMGGR